MYGRRHEIARLQSDLYRNQLRKILRWLLVVIFSMFILIAVVIYLILVHPSQQFYANTTDGKILSMPRQV